MSSPLVFRIYKNDQIFVVKQFVNEDRIVFGSASNANIQIESDEISALHCLVEKRGDDYYLCDLGSEAGTFINDKQVLDQQLASGDHFSIGGFKIFFLVGHQKNAATQTQAGRAQAPETSSADDAAKAVAAAMKAKKAQSEVSQNEKTVKIVQPAGASSGRSLKDTIRAGSGSQLEVIVSWHERVLNTYHFSKSGYITLGAKGDVQVPTGLASQTLTLCSFNNSGIDIQVPSGAKAEVLRNGEIEPVSDSRLTIKNQETCYIELSNGIQLAIRFAPRAPALIFASPYILGVGEFTGVLAALIIAVVTSLIVSISKPKPVEEEALEEVVAKVVFSQPPKPLVQPEPNETQPPVPPQPKPQPVVQKVELDNKKQNAQNKGEAANAAGAQADSGKASEVKPKDSKLKVKMFTSTKQGGAVKTGNNNAANTKSKEPDLKNSGLLAAFGSGGARNKLDKAYSGSGELIGAGERATGSSGFNSDRAGDDLGSRAKDTGAGGMGTATQGIAGVGTQGRGTGMAGLGSGSGFGDKGKVQITSGGGEESFTGTIDRDAVRRVVKSALAQFKACYEREYNMNSSLEGKVVIQWEIHAQGVAKNAIVVRSKSTLNNRAVEECVKNRMMALKFPEPPPGTAAEVTFPFVFRGQKL